MEPEDVEPAEPEEEEEAVPTGKPKAKPTIKSEVEKVQEDAKKKIDRMMKAERQGEVVILDRPPELPAFLRREKWSEIAKRDPPPTRR